MVAIVLFNKWLDDLASECGLSKREFIKNIFSMKGIKMQFTQSRKRMAQEFKRDPELYDDYRLNIARLLNDRYGVLDHDRAAKDVLNKIFNME